MKPHKVEQTQVGEEGNCFAACLASVTGTEIERWPDFYALVEAGADWWKETLAILRDMGWEAMVWQTTHLPAERRASIYPQGFAIVGGNTPRESRENGGFGHAVVWKDGRLWHDPHPTDKSGIDGPPTEFYILFPPKGEAITLECSECKAAVEVPIEGDLLRIGTHATGWTITPGGETFCPNHKPRDTD